MRVRRLIGNWNNLLAVLTAAFVVTCVVNYDALAQGKTTNDSVFTDEQATRGEDAYQQECAQCHLDDLLGDGIAPALIGAPFSFRWSELSVADMLVAIRTTMPQGAPASLSPQAYVDIVAYMLQVNDYPSGDVELPTAESELEAIIIADSQ
jgi:mono/diheme cytochrome c family protein